MNINDVARVAALVGEPARTAMLLELMDGRTLTANELAGAGKVSPQTASKHLAQLVDAGLLAVTRTGRHRYHRLASPEVAKVLEQITVTVPTLIIWGMQGGALLPSLLDGIEQRVPKLRIERVPGASHWLVHEQPDAVEALVGGFVKESLLP